MRQIGYVSKIDTLGRVVIPKPVRQMFNLEKEDSIEKGELFQIIFNKKIPARQFCIVSDDRVPLTAAAEKLLELLQHK